MLINKIKIGKNLELNKENSYNDFKLKKIHRNNSLPNIIFNSNNSKIFSKESGNKLFKNYGRISLKKIRSNNQ